MVRQVRQEQRTWGRIRVVGPGRPPDPPAIISVMTDSSDARAAARCTWPVRRFAVGEEPDEKLSSCTTAQDRLGMMGELAVTAWRLSGRPMPE